MSTTENLPLKAARQSTHVSALPITANPFFFAKRRDIERVMRLGERRECESECEKVSKAKSHHTTPESTRRQSGKNREMNKKRNEQQDPEAAIDPKIVAKESTNNTREENTDRMARGKEKFGFQHRKTKIVFRPLIAFVPQANTTKSTLHQAQRSLSGLHMLAKTERDKLGVTRKRN
jgi:hypothetical protein